jgi:hypothetical protein
VVIQNFEVPCSEKGEAAKPDDWKGNQQEKFFQITAQSNIFSDMPDFDRNAGQTDQQN